MDNINSDILLNKVNILILFSCQGNILLWSNTSIAGPRKAGLRPKRATGSKRIAFEIQSELNYVDSQHAFVSRNQRASFACLSIIGAHSKK